jgi:hypothetical protein
MTSFLRLFLVTVALGTSLGLASAYGSTSTTPCLSCNAQKAVDALKAKNRLSAPHVSAVSLLNWSRDAAVSSFYYSHSNIDAWLQDYSPYFTPLGWTHYYRALKSSGNISKVRDEKITVSATPLEPPKILWQGEDMATYKWHVQMPLLVQYQWTDGKVIQQKLLITLMISRTGPEIGKDGIGIEQFIAKPF